MSEPSDLIEPRRWSLRTGREPWVWGLRPGEAWAVVGPAGAGKSQWLDEIALAAPRAQKIEPLEPSRATPQRILGRATPEQIGRIFSVLRLWDARRERLDRLSGTQLAACRWIEPLRDAAPVLISDGDLDLLDPWTRDDLRDELFQSRRTILATTNHLDEARLWPSLAVLDEGRLLYAGSPQDLIDQTGECEFEVRSTDPSTVRALVEPFALEMAAEKDRLFFRAREGQRRAAELLVQGYGSMTLIAVRPATLQEAIDQLRRSPSPASLENRLAEASNPEHPSTPKAG
ncbi:MAG TPA: hypothetical protein PLO61_00760 [Fimbriimonadaceae bacterium]|nr:hypothetical protein [Fimbriimonadaceae bacterium]HRJ32429.1 hypothetical protein [Fimbriimonadaceae bacterium]